MMARMVLDISKIPNNLGSLMAMEQPCQTRYASMKPRLAGQKIRREPFFGMRMELANRLIARISMKENSIPRVVPRYHWQLRKLMSSRSVMTVQADSIKTAASRNFWEQHNTPIPPRM